MKKCTTCKKFIPVNEESISEYFLLNKKLNYLLENIEKNKKFYNFYKSIFKNLEMKMDTELCLCSHNMAIKKEYLDKYLKKQIKIENNSKEYCFENNNSINIVKNKIANDLKDFLKHEKRILLTNFINNNIIKYNELKNEIKIFHENKNSEKIKDFKTINLLVIYDFRPGENDTKKEFFYYDNVIKDIIKYRSENDKTTYIIYTPKNRTDNFEKIIYEINDENTRKFYLDLFKISEEQNLEKNKRKTIHKKWIIK